MLLAEVDLENLLALPLGVPEDLTVPGDDVPICATNLEGGAAYRNAIAARDRRDAGPDHGPGVITRCQLAVLVGDVVDYSRLMEEDDVDTVIQIHTIRRTILIPLAERHGACVCRAFGGDGALMGFADAMSSIRCAMDIQLRLAEFQERVPFHRRIRLRLGLSFGEGLMVGGAVLYGSPVNVAARLQALAMPGCICVSSDLVAAVPNPLQLELEAMGELRLKNIKARTWVYRLNGYGPG